MQRKTFILNHFTQTNLKYLCWYVVICLMAYFSLSSSGDPLSGNMEEMASKILSDGNFLGKSLLRPESNHTTHTSLKEWNI